MDQNFIETALKMSMALGVVLVVFAGCVFCFKKFSNISQLINKKSRRTIEKPIDVISHQSLGPGKSLYLVKCGQRTILLGATNQSIRHLATVSEASSDELDFESSLKEQTDGSAGEIRKELGRGLKDLARV